MGRPFWEDFVAAMTERVEEKYEAKNVSYQTFFVVAFFPNLFQFVTFCQWSNNFFPTKVRDRSTVTRLVDVGLWDS